jgi:hypothetical protein
MLSLRSRVDDGRSELDRSGSNDSASVSDLSASGAAGATHEGAKEPSLQVRARIEAAVEAHKQDHPAASLTALNKEAVDHARAGRDEKAVVALTLLFDRAKRTNTTHPGMHTAYLNR